MSLLIAALAWLTDPSHWGGDGGIWARLFEHLLVTAGVVAVAVAVAVPVGALIGHTGRGAFLVPFSVGAARSLPTLGLVTLAALWLGIGLGGPVVALLVLAVPPMLAAAHAGVASADRTTVDAARAIGLTEWQVFTRVELPHATGLLVEGLRSTVLQVVATATLAAWTADAGLGRFLFAGLKTRDWAQMIGGALLVVALALVLDLLVLGAGRLLLPGDPQPAPAPATRIGPEEQ
ncbi:ABC transporter permease subunit [Schaalia sp. 19OD2882]|uniref:ABC transporter permease subunit n=1 Tax=Schaalia sp. 19OD2882 TaxID=2794089 RepID=UPI001C1F15CF|nr:ABC transporter permease subunit [Schaalia sp. 19OD2882]QWW19625.1 ABC transporter permease subunit [Schaalia sp. 19OD2882]